MSAEFDYDTTNLRALQEELQRLNAAAFAEGLFGAIPRSSEAGPSEAARKPTKAALKRGKAAAHRLLEMAGRLEDDDSLDVPGTAFTEAGVVRLLAFLRRRRRSRNGAWSRFLGRAERMLRRPVSLGHHVVAGVALKRLQIVYQQILEVEENGLAYLTERRAVRRGRVAQASALMLGGVAPSPSEQGVSP